MSNIHSRNVYYLFTQIIYRNINIKQNVYKGFPNILNTHFAEHRPQLNLVIQMTSTKANHAIPTIICDDNI